MPAELEQLRKQIDETDRIIITAIANRLAIVKKIGVYKKAHGIAALDMHRWEKTVKTRAAAARSLNVSEDLVKKIYDHIHSAALKLEQNI